MYSFLSSLQKPIKIIMEEHERAKQNQKVNQEKNSHGIQGTIQAKKIGEGKSDKWVIRFRESHQSVLKQEAMGGRISRKNTEVMDYLMCINLQKN